MGMIIDDSNIHSIVDVCLTENGGSGIGEWDVSRVTDMSSLFAGYESFSEDLSSWNTAEVTDMSRMFIGATHFNSDLSKWDTSNVATMGFMFDSASSFNSNISDWDISSVTYMSKMFHDAKYFDHELCWDLSAIEELYKFKMFTGSKGKIVDSC